MLLQLLAASSVALLLLRFFVEPLLRNRVTETQLLIGERRADDQPLGQHLIQVDGRFLRTVVETAKLRFPAGAVITCIQAADLLGASVRVVNGGVGRRHVTLVARSRFCLGVKCAVAVYGTPAGPGPRARMSGFFTKTFKRISDFTDGITRKADKAKVTSGQLIVAENDCTNKVR